MNTETIAIPADFEAEVRRLMGDGRASRLLSALHDEPSVSVRLNRAKWQGGVVGGQPVPWCHAGSYLSGRPQFTFDPLLHAGCYYVQEASSMFLAQIVEQHLPDPSAVLDLCAAPGGKTTLLLDTLAEGSVLFCNEPVAARASVLAENVTKWGSAAAVVTSNLPRDYARSGLVFDAILCDVPCSGEGMFRKDEGARSEWSLQNVARCVERQREIVADAWQCLRPGGLLVYSTCTINTRENEENVGWICSELGGELLPVATDEAWNICGSLLPGLQGGVYRFLPGTTRGEGLFMAAIRKAGDAPSTLLNDDAQKAPRRRRQRDVSAQKAAGEWTGWLLRPDDFDFADAGDSIVATPRRLTPLYAVAAKSLRVIHAGVTMCRKRGRDIAPDASLALCTGLRREAFPCVELTYGQAIAYLRREQLTLDAATPRGHVLLTYGGAALGFAKNLGTRANNLHPQEWRIRSTHAPSDDEKPEVLER